MMGLKTIFAINLFGLIASFLARKFIKKSSVAILVPTAFLYLSSICTMYMLTRDREVTETQKEEVILNETDKLVQELSGQQELGLLQSENDKLGVNLVLTNLGLLVPKATLLAFRNGNGEPINSLGQGGAVRIAMLSDGEPITWGESDEANTIANEKLKLSISNKQDGYLNKISLEITNLQDEPQTLKLVSVQTGDPKDTAQVMADKTKKLLSKPASLQKARWAGFTSNYWANYLSGDFDQVKFITSQDVNTIRTEKEITVPGSGTITTDVTMITAPAQVTLFQSLPDPELREIVDTGSGLAGILNKIILLPSLVIFEKASEILGHPLLGMLVLILLVKLVTFYNSYSAHSFSNEMSRIMKIASVATTPDAIKGALLENRNLNIGSKIVSVVLKLVFFMIFYRIFQTSPLFCGSKFLWIQDLSTPDTLLFNNLFGLLPMVDIAFVPRIGLLPSLLGATFFAELYFKNEGSPVVNKNDQQLSVVIVTVILVTVFSKMQSVLCVYIIANSLVDNLQNQVFRKLARRKSKRAI